MAGPVDSDPKESSAAGMDDDEEDLEKGTKRKNSTL
jgi:hypothetical protein